MNIEAHENCLIFPVFLQDPVEFCNILWSIVTLLPIRIISIQFNPQALLLSQTCFSSREDLMATPDFHRLKFFLRPAASLHPCQANEIATPPSSLLEISG